MRKFVTTIGAALLFALAVTAADFRLTWTDTNSPIYQVTGYNLYMAIATNSPSVVASVTNSGVSPLTAVVTNLSVNTYKFYITATNVWGESTPSMAVQTPPGLPSSQGVQLWINLK